MGLTLVVLAAGMASRYGRLKQLEPVGPAGETLLDYGIHDALRAGFTDVLLIIRRETEALFDAHVRAAWPGTSIAFAHQAVDQQTRRRPWGTAHALLAARSSVADPFAVMNADDFYGAAAFRMLRDQLTRLAGVEFILMGYRLADTLSAEGGVSRAICRVNDSGELLALAEYRNVRAADRDVIGERDGATAKLDPGAFVSMNLWGFTPDVFTLLGPAVEDFIRAHADDPDAELALPDVVGEWVEAGRARVRVVPAAGPWLGLTHPGDRARVEARLAELHRAGEYDPGLGRNPPGA